MDCFKLYELQKSLDSIKVRDKDIQLMLIKAYEDKRIIKFERKNGEKCETIMQLTIRLFGAMRTSLFELLVEYSEAIAYAPNDSAVLGRAYGSRSAILSNARLYEDCIKDIDRALALNYPDSLKTKLYIRKAKCFLALGPDYKLVAEQAIAEARHWMVKLCSHDKSVLETRLKKLCKRNSFKESLKKPHYGLILPDIADPHEQLIGASEAIELKYSEKFGRHFVATRDIKPGETLVKTQDYVFVLPPDFMYSHCWNCAKRAWAGIPCKNCAHVIFCDEKCREEAWNNFHDIECSTLITVTDKFIKCGGLIGIKSTIKAIKEAGSIASLKEMVEKINSKSDPLTKGFTQGKLDGSKYASIYTLNNCQSDFIKSVSSKLLSISVSVVILWATETEIFGRKIDNLNDLLSDESILFMVKLLFENMVINEDNAFQANFYQEEEYGNTGAVLSCLTSYFNHSCDPNAFVIHSGNLLGIRSSQKIIKGQQIFVSYIRRYHQLSTNERQKKLKYSFEFCCDCHACEGDWGPKSRWPSIYKQPLPSEVKVKLSKEIDKFKEHFKDMDERTKQLMFNDRMSLEMISDLMPSNPHYIATISELLNILCEKCEYPAKETSWLKNMLIMNYRDNSY